jgi:mRNA interferase RelE/StbE
LSRLWPYADEWLQKARDDLQAIERRDRRTARRIENAITRYRTIGYGDVRRLVGQPDWRLRVGDWRIIFTLEDETRTITIRAIVNRRDAYR